MSHFTNSLPTHSPDRYLPSLDSLSSNEEGEAVVSMCCKCLKFFSKRPNSSRVSIGWHWSPRSWGTREEQTGFQSIPTKWHAMVWNWPKFNSDMFNQVPLHSLNLPKQRVIGGTGLTSAFSSLTKTWIMCKTTKPSFLGDWEATPRGLCAAIQSTETTTEGPTLASVLEKQGFFADFLLPLSIALNDLMVFLCSSFTDMDCDKMDPILKKTEKATLSAEDLAVLRRTPQMKEKQTVIDTFVQHGLPTDVIDLFWEPMQARCKQTDGSAMMSYDVWRKGFGYAFAMTELKEERETRLSIFPGFFAGPVGVCEVMGASLVRPENYAMPPEEAAEKSKALWELADFLRASE
eukprot:TRINITY_DN62838_c0_g1_i3.p1 TRINITY_DN62838_c0_g1~~TRINITY_DN62838_c0_g1_i3.p1  ORF type:complete len:348 (+),score=37.82 TRINITY_DN62838_c0_g1_i3:330-1373(+)